MQELQATEWLQIARSALIAEAEAIRIVSEQLNEDFVHAVEIILAHRGKVIVSGVGKSGIVAQKIAATLSSTGTAAVFLHASDAFHGDFGMISPGDPAILISKTGTTHELLKMVPVLRQFSSPIIGIIGNENSPLAAQVDAVLLGAVHHEADPHNLAPTSSSTVAMALGDALACALIDARQFTPKDFARYHPNGQLGRSLVEVQHVLHGPGKLALVKPATSARDIVIEMTRFPLGAACVVDGHERLIGIITDGDLRRALLAHEDIRPLCAEDIMTADPIVVHPGTTCREALVLMENRPSPISVLPVVIENTGVCVGLIRIHDIYKDNGAN
jgi:arabinose-5-phosphate isomerase